MKQQNKSKLYIEISSGSNNSLSFENEEATLIFNEIEEKISIGEEWTKSIDSKKWGKIRFNLKQVCSYKYDERITNESDKPRKGIVTLG